MILYLLSVELLDKASSQPVVNTGNGLGYILVGIASSAMILAGQFIFRKQQKDKLIAEASDTVAKAAQALLVESRAELQEARDQQRQLRDRVSKLEADLVTAKEDRDRLYKMREQAIRELAITQERVHHLEHELKRLEELLPSPKQLAK